MPQLPTVRIKSKKSKDGLVINERDFDPAEHELFVEAAPEKKTSKKSSKKTSPPGDTAS